MNAVVLRHASMLFSSGKNTVRVEDNTPQCTGVNVYGTKIKFISFNISFNSLSLAPFGKKHQQHARETPSTPGLNDNDPPQVLEGVPKHCFMPDVASGVARAKSRKADLPETIHSYSINTRIAEFFGSVMCFN